MTCRKAYEVDLAGFLADPRGAGWAAFRDHYPRCPVCAAEVRAWTDLHLALGAGSHPEPEALLRFVDEPAALGPADRHRLAAHLEACEACRDEARALRRLDPLAAASPRPVRSAASPRRWAPRIGRILWHPAFAYAVALVLALVPLLTPGRPGRDRGVERIASGRDLPSSPARHDQPEAKSTARNVEPAAPSREERAAPPTAQAPGIAAGEAADASRTARATVRGDVGAGAVALPRDAETEVAAGADATILVLRIEPAAGGAVSTRIVDDQGRMLVDPDGVAVHVPAAWLRPGRYTVEARGDDRVLASARLRVVAP